MPDLTCQPQPPAVTQLPDCPHTPWRHTLAAAVLDEAFNTAEGLTSSNLCLEGKKGADTGDVPRKERLYSGPS